MLASELRSVLTEMLVDKRTTGSRRCHVALVKQGVEENVELCTMLGRGTEESHGRRKEIIETKPRSEATMRAHVYLHRQRRMQETSSLTLSAVTIFSASGSMEKPAPL